MSESSSFLKNVDEPYFRDCFANQVEERHGQEAIELTCASIGSDPVRYQQPLKHAQIMAEALDLLWCSLNNHIPAHCIDKV